MESLQDRILKRISYRGRGAFCIRDFLDLATYDAIRKAIDRLEDEGKIRRIIRGIYDRPRFNERYNLFEAPDTESVAKALSRNYNWTICPSGNLALNLLGLSAQVPARYIYISTGPYVEYEIDGTILEFRHTNNMMFSDLSFITLLLIQALRAIGRKNLTYEDIEHLRIFLDGKDKRKLFDDAPKTANWIREVIYDICEV